MLLHSHRKASQTYQFVDSSHRHSLASYLITGRIKMAFLVFTGTYMRTIMWPTVWRTALSQLYLCIWDGCSKIIHLQGKNQTSYFITEVTIIFCWFFWWLPLFFSCLYILSPLPWCVVWWCLSCLLPRVLPPLELHTMYMFRPLACVTFSMPWWAAAGPGKECISKDFQWACYSW